MSKSITLLDLDKPLEGFDGQPIIAIHDDKPDNITMKLAIVNCLGSAQAENGIGAIRLYSLGSTLYKAKDSITLGPEDFDLIYRAVEANGPRYVPLIQGQVLAYLDNYKG